VLVWSIHKEIENYSDFCVQFWSLKMVWMKPKRMKFSTYVILKSIFKSIWIFALQ